MDILLIALPRLLGLKVSRGSLPMSLMYLASVLRQAGHVPTILDLSIVSIPDGIGPEEYYLATIQRAIRKVRPGFIGLNCFSSMHFPLVREIAKDIRAAEPNVPICLGGVHPTFFPREILENCPEFDFIVTGEGEEQIVALADALASGDCERLKNIQAFGYRSDAEKTVVINPRTTFISDLDALPVPAYDMINFSDYYTDHSSWYNPKGKDIKLSVPIFTTRSCPFNCNFCSAYHVMGRRFRRRNPEKVVDEIEMLVRDLGQNYFSFCDDNVNLDKKHFIAICDGISRRKLDIQLCIAQGLYLNAVDEDIIRAFVGAGGINVYVPIESGNEFIRNSVVGKNLSDEKIHEVVGLLRKYDLFTVGLFIMGFAEDTAETLNDTLSMIHALNLDVNSVNTLTPFPGTKVHQQASRDGLLLFDDAAIWDGKTFFDPQNRREFFIKPYSLSIEELRRFRKIFDDLYITSKRAQILNATHPVRESD